MEQKQNKKKMQIISSVCNLLCEECPLLNKSHREEKAERGRERKRVGGREK